MKICVILLLSFIILVSCKKDKKPSVLISGKWVESKSRADTISFTAEGSFLLLRGKELSFGQLRPRAWSGPYCYNVKSDTISLYWLFSSDSRQNKYGFDLKRDVMTIGDFYQMYQPKGAVLTFTRLR